MSNEFEDPSLVPATPILPVSPTQGKLRRKSVGIAKQLIVKKRALNPSPKSSTKLIGCLNRNYNGKNFLDIAPCISREVPIAANLQLPNTTEMQPSNTHQNPQTQENRDDHANDFMSLVLQMKLCLSKLTTQQLLEAQNQVCGLLDHSIQLLKQDCAHRREI